MKRSSVLGLAVALLACRLFALDDPPVSPPLDKLLGTPVSTARDPELVLSSTAAKYEQMLGSVPASITIITAEEIERYGWTTLDQVLQSVPGFYLTNDRNYTTLGVRGIGRPTDYNFRALILLNGQQLNEPVLGAAPAGSDLALDLRTVQKIEIVRGPGSALYGSHAMHAVINIITATADEMDGLSATARLGSHRDQTGSLRMGRTFGNGLQMTGSALWQESNGANLLFPEYGAVAHGKDYENLYGVALGLRKGDFSLDLSRRSRTKGIPTGSYASLFDTDSWTTNWMDLIAANYHRAIGSDKALDVRASWDRSGEHGLWPYDIGPGVDRTFAVRWSAEARMHWDIRSNQRLTLGGDYTNVTSSRYQYRVGNYQTGFSWPYQVASVFAEYEYRPTPHLGLVAGFRHDDFSCTSDATNPRAAILFTPRDSTTVKLLYGTAFRSPNGYETSYADPETPWKANHELKPERIRTVELEWQQRLSPGLFLTTAVFRNKSTDMIGQQVDPADGVNWYQNLSLITSNGVELRLDRRTERAWSYLSYSFVDADDLEGNIDNHPRHMLKGGLSTSPWQTTHFGLDAVFESGRYTRDEEWTSSFLLLNGIVSRQIAPHVRLGLTARNLLDRRYATPVGPELRQQSIRQDGRTLALEVTFSK